eukprot:TRINITY_DN9995_c0_g1_i1.p1 TRINITY_DN9995_c0_g1~~TRINITY_DN9995_c0_g1_i1.p1  ORF type:complete len:187 (-),score=33.63 TRINITY_DN9995_c0_g1_i1:49-609(-)
METIKQKVQNKRDSRELEKKEQKEQEKYKWKDRACQYIQTERVYASANHTTAEIFDYMNKFLAAQDFSLIVVHAQYSKGSKNGIHLNFSTKFKLYVFKNECGVLVIKFIYYSKYKPKRSIAAAVFTVGTSTLSGVMSGSARVKRGNDFVECFWQRLDLLETSTDFTPLRSDFIDPHLVRGVEGALE